MLRAVLAVAFLAAGCASSWALEYKSPLEILYGPPAHLDFRIIRDGPEPIYELRGDIEFGASATFIRALADRRGGWLSLDSQGGSEGDAIEIGRWVRARGIKTTVASYQQCLSGCAMIWAAGVERYIGDHARVGFHRPWHMSIHDKPVDGDQSRSRDYFAEMGYSQAAIEKFMWPFNSFFWLTPAKAKKLHIDVKFGD